MIESVLGRPANPEPDGRVESRRAGRLYAATGILATAAGLGLAATLHFPEVLLDPPSFGSALIRANPAGAVLSLLALAGAGLALMALARRHWAGLSAGACWLASALLALVLLPLRTGGAATALVFIGAAVAAPVLAAVWTAARRGFLGAVGLLVTAARSVVWLVDTRLSPSDGWYITSAALTVAALIGCPLWLWWLAATGWRLYRPARSRWWVAVAAIFVPAYTLAAILVTPTPRTDDVPAVPSAAGSVRYAVLLAFAGAFKQPTTYQELVAARREAESARSDDPPGTAVRGVDAGGVPAEYLCAPGARSDRVALYLHGGGFVMPLSRSARAFAAEVSRQSRACVLIAHYRLAPEHPYPAARQDGVAAYRWLLGQGIPGAHIAIFGDSAGGNLALTTALALRGEGAPLPAALASVSGVTDLTLTGPTVRTHERAEAIITRPHRDLVVRGYVAGADPRDPLLSPLYADPAGLPPTLLQVGSQEVLLSDATRMAADVVLMDVRMPMLDGIEATRRIVAAGPDGPAGSAARILVLTTFELDEYVYAALRAGASGFLLKDAPPAELVAGIRVVAAGVRVVAAGDAALAPAVTRRLIEAFTPHLPGPDGRTPRDERLDALTDRERQVLDHLARGRSNAEIAGALFISEATVKVHVGRILTKLGLRDRAQVVVFAYEYGVVRPGTD